MVNSCCVTGCNNESYPGSRFSFHEFPKNENQKLKWENVVDRGGLKYASAFVFDVVKYNIEKLFFVMSPDLHSLNMKKMLNMTLHQFSSKIKRISPIHPSSDETHELELFKCIGQKYLSLSYGKSLTLKQMGDKATLRQKLYKTVLFSNV